ncbi:hypothetical protein [Novosphingobium mathurense]|uniref:Uncharacterized protein n=1 Tax=Novosphingobium mathurense TaxID=428990 RepID=A0A1U6IML8_9SPHN|nr:hypothetical protein [Novosphingobium mathurense]SLK09217.1 hypothetical protein SAMN06295987_109107 [Novosphingobium mathurense]
MPYYIEIGAAPWNEDCAQLGQTPDFATINRLEVDAYRGAMIAAYGPPPKGITFAIRSNPHDFGTYRELAVKVDKNDFEDATAAEYLDKLENGLTSWISAGFTAPVSYLPGAQTRKNAANVNDLIRSAKMVTRPMSDGRFFPASNST